MTLSTPPTRPEELRSLIRKGELTRPTSGFAPGYVQTNLVFIPKDLSFDFLLFCQRNPKPCPLIEVVEAGSAEPTRTAPGSDLRTDAAKYRVFRHGQLEAEVEEITDYWQDDLVSFLIGCSFTFEAALIQAGIRLQHVDQGTNVSMFVTSIEAAPAGAFSGPLVVTMRPIPQEKVVRAVQVTSRYPSVHGSPVHIGDPAAIGVRDISVPDIGDPVEIREGDVPVFWACGVTPQAVAMSSKPPLMITHAPGHMFITDLHNEDLAVL